MKIPVALFAMLLLLPAAAHAERKVSLKEAIGLAMERNHLIKAADYEREASAREFSASRSRYLPRLYLDESFAVSDSPTRVFMMKLDEGRFTADDFKVENLNHPKTKSDFRTAFTLEQPLLDLNIGYSAGLAQKEAQARELSGEQRREDVGLEVFGSYLDVRRAKARLAVAEEGVADAKEHLRLAVVRSKAGVGLRSDELRARTFLSEREQELISALNDLALARMRLSLATGGSGAEPLDIGDDIEAFPLARGERELLALALENRRDLKEMEKGVEQAELRERMAKGEFFPTVYASAAYQMNDRSIPFGRDNDAWQAGVNLRWELFDGMRRWNGREKARARKNAVAEQLESSRKEVAFQVSRSLLRREEAGKRLEVARHAVLDAEEGVRLISKRFENSIATMVELLDSQTAFNTARVSLVDSEDAYLLATARVYHAAGIFLKEVMK